MLGMACRKGEHRERELVNRLDAIGFAVMRAPASGSATDRELPDALAGDGENFYAIEAKSSAGHRSTLTAPKLRRCVTLRVVSVPSLGSPLVLTRPTGHILRLMICT